eukprot:CAMPEP_0184451500 /NCGR_PEP_ID=MMETSP0740-20130409/6480_1 /TAXON_ID=385413 /ORGANISM="Thalassiosira miniscula, Strain CCMP1093" /LENGTH=118 /DNA_ID=CAMNT_0026822013 /DNA_START=315 /DNA_END=672 /DNA_ORIENTATION=-
MTQPTAGFGQQAPDSAGPMTGPAPCNDDQSRLLLGRLVWTQFAYKFIKVIGGLEVLVDAGKADICHGINPRQSLHDNLTNGLRRDIRFAHAFQSSHNAADHLINPLWFNRAFLHGNAD